MNDYRLNARDNGRLARALRDPQEVAGGRPEASHLLQRIGELEAQLNHEKQCVASLEAILRFIGPHLSAEFAGVYARVQDDIETQVQDLRAGASA